MSLSTRWIEHGGKIENNVILYPSLQIERFGLNREDVLRVMDAYGSRGVFYCPGCLARAGFKVTEENRPDLVQRLVRGKKKRIHFAHKAKGTSTRCNPRSNRETDQHIAGKTCIYETLKRDDRVSEVFLDCKRIGKRKPDVHAVVKTGLQESHEVQLSDQSLARFLNRSMDLKDGGSDLVTWYIDRESRHKNGLMQLSLERPWIRVQFIVFSVEKDSSGDEYYDAQWFPPSTLDWAKAQGSYNRVQNLKKSRFESIPALRNHLCDIYINEMNQVLEIVQQEQAEQDRINSIVASIQEEKRWDDLENVNSNKALESLRENVDTAIEWLTESIVREIQTARSAKEGLDLLDSQVNTKRSRTIDVQIAHQQIQKRKADAMALEQVKIKSERDRLRQLRDMARWLLGSPELPVPPFQLADQPYVTIVDHGFYDVMKRECRQYLANKPVLGQARFEKQLFSVATMGDFFLQRSPVLVA